MGKQTVVAAPERLAENSDESRKTAIEARDIEKCFGALEVLKGVSFSACEGSVLSIIGASGSGKSTLLRCMNLLEVPTRGEIHIAGEDIQFTGKTNGRPQDLDRRQVQRLRSKVTMVFQQFNLWPHMTVLGNVIEAPMQVLGLSRKDAEARGRHYLDRVNMLDKQAEYPAFLSGGQQQRTAIARALAMEPRVLLFDEPTSALDPELVGEVLNVIRQLVEEGRTMMLVTHEMTFARDVSSQVIFLHNGIVEEKGAPEKVFAHSESARCRQFVASVAE